MALYSKFGTYKGYCFSLNHHIAKYDHIFCAKILRIRKECVKRLLHVFRARFCYFIAQSEAYHLHSFIDMEILLLHLFLRTIGKTIFPRNRKDMPIPSAKKTKKSEKPDRTEFYAGFVENVCDVKYALFYPGQLWNMKTLVCLQEKVPKQTYAVVWINQSQFVITVISQWLMCT